MTSLYRFYDSNGRLLYVGITVRLPLRLRQHNDTKPWWTDVSDVTVEHFASRPEAARAEQEAIRLELPLFNIQHRPVLSAFDELALREPLLRDLAEYARAHDPRNPEYCWLRAWHGYGGYHGVNPLLMQVVGAGRPANGQPSIVIPKPGPSDFEHHFEDDWDYFDVEPHGAQPIDGLWSLDEFLDAGKKPERLSSVEVFLASGEAYDLACAAFMRLLPSCDPCPHCDPVES